MIKSTIKKSTYQAIYRLLDRVSPLPGDCGKLCGAACCTVEGESEMGIYLLPGEDKIHDKSDPWLKWTTEDAENYEFPDSWRGKVFFVRCTTPPICPREKRPIQCRTYPLIPHIYADGELDLMYNDALVPYKCPIIEEEMPLEERFVKATYTVWKRLITDPLIYDLIRSDSIAREEAALELQQLLSKE